MVVVGVIVVVLAIETAQDLFVGLICFADCSID